MNDALRLNADLVDRARVAASAIADDIQQHIEDHTTDTTERATLRLLGISGVNEIDVPLVNVVAEHARELLPGGIMRPFADVMIQTGKSAQESAAAVMRAVEAGPAITLGDVRLGRLVARLYLLEMSLRTFRLQRNGGRWNPALYPGLLPVLHTLDDGA